MSLLQETVRGLSDAQIDALLYANEETGLLGPYLTEQTRKALFRKRLAASGYLTPFGVSVREYLVTRDDADRR